MANWLTLLTATMVGSVLSLSAMEARTSVEFEIGYRHDQISWDFKVPSPDPLVESDLSFKNVHILQLGLNGQTVLDCNVLLRARASYGWVLDGDTKETLKNFGTETDDVQALTTLKSRHILDGRYVADLSIGIGYPFYFCDCTLSLSPVIGYSYSTQNFKEERNSRDFFAGNTTTPAITLVHDDDVSLHNFYINRWYGPWVGVDVTYAADCCLNFWGQFEYHWGCFKGKRESSIGLDFIDGFDRASRHAHGAYVKLGVDYGFCDCWYVGLNATYQDWAGHKKSNYGDALVDGGFVTPAVQATLSDHFRSQANWRSFAVAVAVGRGF